MSIYFSFNVWKASFTFSINLNVNKYQNNSDHLD